MEFNLKSNVIFSNNSSSTRVSGIQDEYSAEGKTKNKETKANVTNKYILQNEFKSENIESRNQYAIQPSASFPIDAKIQLINYNCRFGNKWKLISQYFNPLHPNNLKNLFFTIARKCLRKSCRILGITKFQKTIHKLKSTEVSKFFILYSHNVWENENTDYTTSIRELVTVALTSVKIQHADTPKIDRLALKKTIAQILILKFFKKFQKSKKMFKLDKK